MIPPRRGPSPPTRRGTGRRCGAAWLIARRSPISPVRSMTVTSVTLAIPIAPTTSEITPAQELAVDVALHLLAGGAPERVARMPSATRGRWGLSATGACSAIRPAAPSLGLDDHARAGSHRSARRRRCS